MNSGSVTAIIVTYRREVALRRCLIAINDAATKVSRRPEIVVVTQADGVDYSQLRDEFSWAQWIVSDAVGLSSCRNAGADRAVGRFLFFLDDDCVVSQRFFVALESILDEEEPTALSGQILTLGSNAPFVPQMSSAARIVSLREYGLFMGSCHGMRADIFRALSGYDARFGAGAMFGAAEETDLLLRILESGREVFYRPELQIWHSKEGQDDPGRNRLRWVGMGALYVKHLRAGIVLGSGFAVFLIKPFCSGLLRLCGILPRNGRAARSYRELVKGIVSGCMQYVWQMARSA